MPTLLESSQSVLVLGVSLFQGLFLSMQDMFVTTHMSTLQWVSVFQGYLQGGVPLYFVIFILVVRGNHENFITV